MPWRKERKRAREGERQDCANGGRLDHRTESVVEVDARALREPTKNPAGFVALQGAIGIELVLEYPLAGDDVGPGRPRDQIPSFVELQGGELFLHRRQPIGIGKSCAVGLGNGRQGTTV
jgi:hypothetical protein